MARFHDIEQAEPELAPRVQAIFSATQNAVLFPRDGQLVVDRWTAAEGRQTIRRS